MSKYYPFSDFPLWGESYEEIVIVQPGPTAGLDKENFLATGEFEPVYAAVIGNKLVHTGTLFCAQGGEPRFYYNCGGALVVTPAVHRPSVAMFNSMSALQRMVCSELGKQGWPTIQCAHCGMLTGPKVSTAEELRTHLFHLMIKQMIPFGWFSCNYTDCSQTPVKGAEKNIAPNIAPILKLGVVSVVSELLWGLSPENADHERRGTSGIMSNHSLGFVMVPGIRSLTHGCDGFDEWLKFLFVKYRKYRNKAVTKAALGPKPAR